MKTCMITLALTAVTCSMAHGYVYSDYTWHTYNGHQYAITLDYSNWAQAEVWAQEVGGHLAAINDSSENDFLAALITGHPTQANDPMAWIGLDFIGGDSDSRYSPELWQWVTGESITVWYPYPGWLPAFSGIHGYLGSNDCFYPRTWGWNPVHETVLSQQPYGIIEIPCAIPPAGSISIPHYDFEQGVINGHTLVPSGLVYPTPYFEPSIVKNVNGTFSIRIEAPYPYVFNDCRLALILPPGYSVTGAKEKKYNTVTGIGDYGFLTDEVDIDWQIASEQMALDFLAYGGESLLCKIAPVVIACGGSIYFPPLALVCAWTLNYNQEISLAISESIKAYRNLPIETNVAEYLGTNNFVLSEQKVYWTSDRQINMHNIELSLGQQNPNVQILIDADMRLSEFYVNTHPGTSEYYDSVHVFRILDFAGLADTVLIPGGEFMMGDSFSEGQPYERPVHPVRLDSFYMGKYEVTNQQYCAFLNWANGNGWITVTGGVVYKAGSGTSYPYCSTSPYGGVYGEMSQIAYSGGVFSVRTKAGRNMSNDPMVMVSWCGAAAYCNWRSQQEGKQASYNLGDWTCDFSKNGYRLPTEAEWEYAARGGLSGSRFPCGDTISHTQANYYSDSRYSYDVSPTHGYHPAWNDGIYPYTSPVGSFPPTGYGLYDMTGNNWEWCNDWWGIAYYDVSPYDNPPGPAIGDSRVRRGGGWGDTGAGGAEAGAYLCRVSERDPSSQEEFRSGSIGFRVARRLEKPEWSFVHMTDTHIGAKQCVLDENGKCKFKDAEDWFADALYEISKMDPLPEFILNSGDIVDQATRFLGVGDSGLYERYLQVLDSYPQLKSKVYSVPGNHDRYFGNADLSIYDEHIKRPDGTTPLDGPHDYIFERPGFIFVGLDSGEDLGKGYTIGQLLRGTGLTDDQMNGLRDPKKIDPAKAKIVFMHHPAINQPEDEWVISKNQPQLISYCADSANHVELILAGHTHEDHTFDENGNEPAISYPHFIQTPSAGKNSTAYPHGYRVIDIENGLASPREYSRTEEHDKKTAKLHSAASLHVYDSLDRHTGLTFTGEPERNIPDSFYLSHGVNIGDGNEPLPEKVILYEPCDNYLYEVGGTESGTYRLEIVSTEDGDDTVFEAKDIPTVKGAVHQYVIDWDVLSEGGDGVLIAVDDDGDGDFERTITADNELTLAEFDTEPPTITCAGDLTLECPADTSIEATGRATATDNYDDAPDITYADTISGDCSQVIERTWTATDEAGNSSSCVQTITVEDTTPPVITCPPNVTLECPADTSVAANGTATAVDTCGDVAITSSDVWTPACGNTGTLTRTWAATDECGNTTTCAQIITVVDTIPPSITSISANPSVLWAPNHKMEAVIVSVAAGDTCDATPVCRIINVTANEPINGKSDGNTQPDWEITGGLTVNLRAERSGKASGRVYTVHLECRDACGNSTTATVDVAVSHDQGKKKGK